MRCTMAAQGGMGAARHPAALHPGISRILYGSDRDFLPPPQIPLLTTWKGQLCARLNVTSEAALGWYLARARRLRQALGATYVAFEGVEGNSFLEQDVPAPAELAGDGYTEVLAAALATLGNGTVISAGTRWAPGRGVAGADGHKSCRGMVELVLGTRSRYSEMFLGTQGSGEEVG